MAGVLERLLRRISRRLIYERKSPRRRPVAVTTRFRVRSGSRQSAYVEAQTRDLSATGLAIETKTMRVDGLHVYDSADMVTSTRLDIVLGIPSGNVAITGETVRYDALSEGGYLLGIHIVEMPEADHDRYLHFLDALKG